MTNCLLWTASRAHRVGQTEQLIRMALVYAGQRLGRDTLLLEGEAPGGDTIARNYWRGWRLPVHPCPADWAGPCDPAAGCTPDHRRRNSRGLWYCPLAGHRRNQSMVDRALRAQRAGAAVLCVAMPRGLPSAGTYDCAGRALAAGLEVWPPFVVDRLRAAPARPASRPRSTAIVCSPGRCEVVALP